MSTTEALLGNLTEMPGHKCLLLFSNTNLFHSFGKKKASQPGVDYVAANFVTGGACNEFSVAILKRKSVKSFLTI